MINWKIVLIACGIASGGWLIACNKGEKTAADKNASTAQARNEAAKPEAKVGAMKTKDSTEHRNQAIEKMKAELDTLGNKIDQLQKKADKTSEKVSDKTKREMKAQVKNLKEERAKMSKRLDELKTSTSESWDDLREKTGRGMDSLKVSVERLWDKATK